MARRRQQPSLPRPGHWLAAFLLLISLPAWSATYSVHTVPFSWDDPGSHQAVPWTGTGGVPNECQGSSAPIDDGLSKEIPLGFTFPFGGTGHTTVRVMSNGRLQFGNRYCGKGTQDIGPPRTYPYPYPNNNLNATLRGLGIDWDPSAGGSVTYATLGSGASQRFVVTWSKVPEGSGSGGTGSLDMQMVLYANGDFEYRYGTLDYTTGGQPQIGWQLDNSDYALYDYGTVGGLQNTAIRWSPSQAVSGCGDVFPYALQNSAQQGEIELKDHVQILDSPGNTLGTAKLKVKNSSNACGGGNCQASGSPAQPALTSTFQSTTASNDVTVPKNGQFSLGSDHTAEYRSITVKKNAILTDSNRYTAYRIARLTLKKDVTWILQGGHDYWVGELAAADNRVTIRTAPGTGTARLFIEKKIEFKKVSLNSGGNPASLMVVAYNNLELEKSTASALIVGLKKVEIDNSVLTGAVSASGKLEVKKNSSVTFDATAVASVDHRGLCRGNGGTPQVAGYAITHDGHGIHCLDEPVTLEALDAGGNPVSAEGLVVTLDTGTGKGTWTLQSGTGTLTDALADDGLASYSWGTGETTATFLLQYRQGPRVVNISASDGTASGAATPLPFDPSGFVLTSQPLGNPPPNPIPAFSAQTAGTPFTAHLTAYGITTTDPTCGVIESYDGSKILNFWSEALDPATQILPMQIDGSPVGTSAASATPVAVAFSQGQGQVRVKYKDVGRIALHARDPSVTDPNLPTGFLQGNAPFVSRPADFVLSQIVAPAGATPTDCVNNTTPNPAAAGPGGGLFTRAGAPFCVTATAVDAEGDPTPSFGQESTPENLVLSSSLSSDCGAPCISNPGLTVVEDFSVHGFSGGAATGRFSWAEVGIIDLRADIADGDYLGSGNVTGGPSGNVGRFAPWDFGVTLNNAPSFQPASSGFTYLGQPFGYNTAPSVTITARNRSGGTTKNYDGAWWKLPDLTVSYAPNPALPADTSFDSTAATVSGFDCVTTDACDGTATVLFGGSFVIQRQASDIAPFDASIDLSFPVDDGDARYAANPFTISAVAFDDGDPATTTDSQMRSGRAVLGGTYGQENQALRLYFWTQYFDGSGFVNNDLDTATRYTAVAGNPACAEMRGPVACGDVTLSGTAGHGQWFDLSPPGKAGVLQYTLDVDPWLEYDWNGNGAIDDDPQAQVVFGIFRGDDRMIHWREAR